MKNDVRFEYVPWKDFLFCFISIVWVDFSHKTEKCRFRKSFEILKYFLIKKDMPSDLIMSHGKVSDFVSFVLFWFTLVIKRRIFEFESHWNIHFTLIFFWSKTTWYQVWICPTNSVWFVSSIVAWVTFWQEVDKYDF